MDNTKVHNGLCKQVQDLVQWVGGFMFKCWGGPLQRKGLPDLIGCLKGVAVYVEVKTGRGELSADQKTVRQEIECAGGIYIECRRLEDVTDRLLLEGLIRPGQVQL